MSFISVQFSWYFGVKIDIKRKVLAFRLDAHHSGYVAYCFPQIEVTIRNLYVLGFYF